MGSCRALVNGVQCGATTVDQSGYCPRHDEAAATWAEIKGFRTPWQRYMDEQRAAERQEADPHGEADRSVRSAIDEIINNMAGGR